MSKGTRGRLGAATLGLLMAGLVWSAPQALKPEDPAARVNGKAITAGELQAECTARFGAETLAQMVQYMVVNEAAAKQKIEVTDQEIMRKIKTLQMSMDLQRPRTGTGFREWMQSRRISLRELASQARMELQLEKMVASKVTVTDEDLSRYYQSNREKFRQPERMLISHIAVETKEEAERVRQEIVTGKITFADAARKYSVDPYGRENGGLFGWIARGEDPIQKAAYALAKDGDLSPPVQGKKGWEIIRRDAYQSENIPTFEQAQETIREVLTAEKTQRLAQQMMGELTRAANVEQLVDFRALNDDMRALIEAAQQLDAEGGAAPQ